MVKIFSNIIPPASYKALTIWPVLFIREKMKDFFDEVDERHEKIHGEQQKELLFVGALISAVLFVAGAGWWSLTPLPMVFYLYGLCYIAGLIRYGSHRMAYRNNPFEAEAYIFEADTRYLPRRRRFA